MKKSKRNKKILEVVSEDKQYSFEEAVETLKQCPEVKFDQTIEISMKLGADPKKSDQQVRGGVTLPYGTGKKILVTVFAKGNKVKEALEAGADFAGAEELLAKVKGGWTDFSAVVATPDMMREVGKLGKILGPRGLMPTPKAGTVTADVAGAVKAIKGGKIEFKIDKSGVINGIVGKLSFASEKIVENIKVFVQAINKAKPSSVKGVYIKSVVLSSTMGPGLKIEAQNI
jgi:large subunit ribosomal protein L1